MKLNNLPKKYLLSYQFSEFLYNNLVATYNSCLSNKIFDTKIIIKDKRKLKKFIALKDHEVIDWLLANDYKEEHFLITYKLILRGLIYDSITHISESLQNILKGNNVIAYSLLRKPFRENLTVLEKIYSDPILFYEGFISGNFSSFDPYKISKDKNEIMKLIEKSIMKLEISQLFSYNVIYSLRFDKLNQNSFDVFWNKAIHLVTNARGIETEKMNFNFIFSGEDEKIYQWDQIFYSLPILLYYLNRLFESMLKLIAFMKFDDGYETRRLYGYLLWAEEVHNTNIQRSLSKKNFPCPKCKKKIYFSKNFLFNYCFEYIIKCNKCNKVFDLTKIKFEATKFDDAEFEREVLKILNLTST